LTAGTSPPSLSGVALAPFPIGPRGDFELLELLGSGAMGAVYRARELASKREVALKVLIGPDVGARVRFSREGEIAASLVHPSIMRVHSAGVLEGHPYLACELIPGSRTLGDVWPELNLAQRVGLVAQAARALGHAHRQGILHRDVKPANLLVAPDGRLKVADFGLATMDGLERLTRTGAVVGTALYMAPEVVAGERHDVGPHTDVWSLGVVLYELLTGGELPFEAPGWAQLGSMILSAPHPPLAERAPRVPRALGAVVDRALAKAPAQRYPHGDALAADLETYLAGGSPNVRLSRRVTWGGAAAGFGLGAALILSIWALLPAPSPPPQPTPTPSRAEVPPASPSPPRASPSASPPAPVLLEQPEITLTHSELGGRVATAFSGPQRLLSWGQDGWLREWDLRSGETTHESSHAGGSIQFTPLVQVLPSGEVVLSLGRRLVWLTTPPASTDEIYPYALALSPDGARLAVASGLSQGLTLFRASTREEIRRVGEGLGATHTVCFDASGRYLATSRGDKGMGVRREQVVELYEVATGEQIWRRPTYGYARAAARDGQGRLWFGTNQGIIEARSVDDGEVSGTVGSLVPEDGLPLQRPALAGSIGDLVCHAGRLYAACGVEGEPHAGQLAVWDLASGDVLAHKTGRPWQAPTLSISPDGQRLAVGSERGTVEVWRLQGSP
jgi:serine/threonine-protein kinase